MGPTGKKLYPFVILVAVAIGILWGLHSRRNASAPAEESPEANRKSTTPAAAHKAANPTATAVPPTNAPNPASLPTPAAVPEKASPTPYVIGSAEAPPEMDPATVVGNMRNVIHNYGSTFNGNPVGTNPEITAALNGDNPKGIKFINEGMGLRVNGRGELVDYWGTPFFFHQISGSEMEIRSAGPDKKMYTADDLVMK